jgi:hypothetical protein
MKLIYFKYYSDEENKSSNGWRWYMMTCVSSKKYHRTHKQTSRIQPRDIQNNSILRKKIIGE